MTSAICLQNTYNKTRKRKKSIARDYFELRKSKIEIRTQEPRSLKFARKNMQTEVFFFCNFTSVRTVVNLDPWFVVGIYVQLKV